MVTSLVYSFMLWNWRSCIVFKVTLRSHFCLRMSGELFLQSLQIASICNSLLWDLFQFLIGLTIHNDILMCSKFRPFLFLNQLVVQISQLGYLNIVKVFLYLQVVYLTFSWFPSSVRVCEKAREPCHTDYVGNSHAVSV